MQFSDDEMSHLKEIFDLFDRDKTGTISLRDLEAIM
jgi:Ca2+-binding EF-hand superfamily protein